MIRAQGYSPEDNETMRCARGSSLDHLASASDGNLNVTWLLKTIRVKQREDDAESNLRVHYLDYRSSRSFSSFAMFASGLILGIIFPVLDVKSVVTPGPCPEITQSLWTTIPTDMAPCL